MGASILGGLFETVLGFFLKPLRKFFPAVVTGTVAVSYTHLDVYKRQVKYRVQTSDGRMMGGAMYALERGLKWKKFGKVMEIGRAHV